MTNEELLDMLIDIQGRKCETQMLEIKAEEIPGIDLAERPCYYTGKGRLKGAYVRVGDSDEPMTEYEVYSYEAFRKEYQDDIRIVPRATFAVLDRELLGDYIERLKRKKLI